MRVIDIPELIITLVKAKYDNVKSREKVDCECNNVFYVDISVHQCFVLGLCEF